MKTNIQENLSRSLFIWGDKPAVVAKDGTVSYQMLERYSTNIAQSIRTSEYLYRSLYGTKQIFSTCHSGYFPVRGNLFTDRSLAAG